MKTKIITIKEYNTLMIEKILRRIRDDFKLSDKFFDKEKEKNKLLKRIRKGGALK